LFYNLCYLYFPVRNSLNLFSVLVPGTLYLSSINAAISSIFLSVGRKPLFFKCLSNSSLKATLNSFFDVRLLDSQPFAALLAVFAAAPQAGCVYPRQVDVAGAVQDHERLLPTPGRLLRRHLFRRRHEVPANSAGSADWVNAAFMLLRGTAFAQVGGFDERYHMYGEDVDLCLRLRLAGWILMRADSVVEHIAQRASHRDLRHLCWHLASLLRLWRSPVYLRFKRLHAAGYSKSV